MAAPNVPPIGSVAAKWRRRVEGASGDYKDGVTARASRWQPAASAAGASYKSAVSAADIQQRYTGSINAAAGAKYLKRATMVGPDRYAQAAPVAEPDFSAGMAPVLAAIAAVDLPPRGPRGSAGNYNRVKPIGDALNRLRMTPR